MDERQPEQRPILTFPAETRLDQAPTLWVFISDDAERIARHIKTAERPLLIATRDASIQERFEDAEGGVRFFLTGHAVGAGFNGLLNVRDILLSAYFDGIVGSNDRILVEVQTEPAWQARLYYDLGQETSTARLKRELEYAADVQTIEAVLHIAAEIAREGREHGHVGALFVVGDTDRVMANSRPIVLNPFEGHPEAVRNIKDPDTWETAKEFSQIDGAFIISGNGLIQAAGRYIDVTSPVELPSGLGGRHLASAAITKETKAVAVTVSETGVIRIFKDGEILLKIGAT